MKKKYIIIPIVILTVLILAFSVPAMIGSLTVAQNQSLAKSNQNISPSAYPEHPKPLGPDESDKIVVPDNTPYLNKSFPIQPPRDVSNFGKYNSPSELNQSIYQPTYLEPQCPNESYNKILELYEEGWSRDKIAEELGFPLYIVSRFLEGNYTPPSCPEPDQSTSPAEHSKHLYPDKSESDNIPQASVVSPSPGEAFGTEMYSEYEEKTWYVYAGQEVRPSLSLPSASCNLWLYAPTLMCPNHCPLEAVTAYFRYADSSTTEKEFWVWNHSQVPNPVFSRPIDSTFLSNYVRDYPEGKLYFVETGYWSPYWKVLLYNFTSGNWEEQYSSTATISRADYWDIWEYYFDSSCPSSLPDIESAYLQAYFDGTWRQINETYGFEHDTMVNCSYERYFVDEYHHWDVTGYPSGVLVASKEGDLSGTGATYNFSVSGDTKYTVVMAGNESADFDLYAKWGSPPTTSDYDARCFSATSLEYFTTSGSGTLYIMVRSWSGSGHWKCWVMTRGPSDNSGRKTGTLSGTGATANYSISGTGIAGHGYAFNSGPDSSDFDLYVKWNFPPTTSSYDDRGFTSDAQEIAHYKGKGTFYWMVRSWSGSGEYATVTLVF
ncbi:MAG TPA: hypothetical protein C5S37_14415 [Methanophagales archaeon]|nr:hypothetical protein [Methanophagales archaeon]